MKRLFLLGLVGLLVFEIASVWFIMPLPGSQRVRSIDVAYAIYQWRWAARALLGLCVLAGGWAMWSAGGWRRWLVAPSLVVLGAVAYMVNYKMSADHMFLQPTIVDMRAGIENHVALDRLVVGIAINSDARAYPLQYIGYHHQVRDTVGGQDVLISYCTVCRTARVFKPVIDGKSDVFRLVGMDHFNAMLEDRTTGSWWRQANGEAITGAQKGKTLSEIQSVQVTLKQWLEMHPNSRVMQADPKFAAQYAKDYSFERGTSKSTLTGTDTTSWGEKSWVVGITVNQTSKAFDWNRLRKERVINDEVGGKPIVLVMTPDDASFFAFERPDAQLRFALQSDSLVADGHAYALTGHGASGSLEPVKASQEFWHSWRTFQPTTERY